MAGIENKGSAAKSTSPRTPYLPSTSATDAPTPALVGVYPSAESRNYPLKSTRNSCAVSGKLKETRQKSPTVRKMRTFLGPLTDVLANPTPTPAMHAPKPRLLRYSDSSSSGSRPVSSKPSGHGLADRFTPRSNHSPQSRLTVQLTPVKAASSVQPGEEQTLVAVRLLSIADGQDADAEKPNADDSRAPAAPRVRQGAVQSSPTQSTHIGSSSSGNTAIWAAQPPGSIDMRGAMRRPTLSPVSRAVTARLSPKMSPVRRFAYAPQSSALASAYSLERFQVSPLKPSNCSPAYVAPPQQHAYTPWAARPAYAEPEVAAGPQQPPRNEAFSFPDPHRQQPYPDYPYMGAPCNLPGPKRVPLFAEYSMPPQGQVMPGTDQPGVPEQRSFFTHEHMQTKQQAAYVQDAYSPQQYMPPLHEVPPLHVLPPGLHQEHMPPFLMRQAGEHSPVPQDVGMQWWAGPARMPYERSPKARRRLARSYMGSPPYVKDLRTPDRARARAAREPFQAPTQAAAGGIPATASVQGTGAFIPAVPTTKRTAAYVAPALRAARGRPMRSSNPLTDRSVEEAAVMCHVMHSKGQMVEEVDKATVKALVRRQIALGKPLFAPWYRDEDGTPQEGSQTGSWHRADSQTRPHYGARPMYCPS